MNWNQPALHPATNNDCFKEDWRGPSSAAKKKHPLVHALLQPLVETLGISQMRQNIVEVTVPDTLRNG